MNFLNDFHFVLSQSLTIWFCSGSEVTHPKNRTGYNLIFVGLLCVFSELFVRNHRFILFVEENNIISEKICSKTMIFQELLPVSVFEELLTTRFRYFKAFQENFAVVDQGWVL